MYKAKLRGTEKEVAIKVQRPDMVKRVSLDLFLLNKHGEFMDAICKVFTEQVPFHVDFLDCFARASYAVSIHLRELCATGNPFLLSR